MRADKIHRAGRWGILSNGKRDRGSLSSFFSFRLVSLVSSFAKEETREMRQKIQTQMNPQKQYGFLKLHLSPFHLQ